MLTGVALTGRNTTGPPRAALWRVTLHMQVLQTTDDDDRRQRPLLVWAPTLIFIPVQCVPRKKF